MLVFRSAQQSLWGERLRNDLLQELRAAPSLEGEALRNLLVSTLLRAGELECGLADVDSPSASAAASITDLMAQALLDPALSAIFIEKARGLLEPLPCSETLDISLPEGFCYYGVHPMDYAELTRSAVVGKSPVAVVGIRSIGTTLSAVVKAAADKLQFGGVPTERITVRPQGHEYERTLAFSERESAWVDRHRARGAVFLVVDEGPGLSGSSLLSVGEALVAQGVSAGNIRFMCSHEADPERLVAANAAERWRKFEVLFTPPSKRTPAKARKPWGGDAWREDVFSHPEYESTLYADPRDWPAIWSEMSAARLLSSDRTLLFKYEGLGRYGQACRARAALTGEAGFGPSASDAGDGFTQYPIIPGWLLSSADLSEGVLERMANYLAFRGEMFRAAPAPTRPLEAMTQFNCKQLTGKSIENFYLEVERPVIADGRMMPHEWLCLHSEAKLLKLDNAAHGDNHFFPGPVDIAWDLAGAIVEWDLQADAAAYFLGCYQSASGDNARRRLSHYLVAYCAFHGGYSFMAATAMEGSSEQKLLLRDALRYRNALVKHTAVLPRHGSPRHRTDEMALPMVS